MNILATLTFLILAVIVSFSLGLQSEARANEVSTQKSKQKQTKEDHSNKKETEHDDHGEAGDHDDHNKGQKTEQADHKDHEEHDEHGEEGEQGEENVQVGPNKGIVEASKENGFKLSAEAEKNFSIQRVKVLNLKAIQVPREAVVSSGIEVNLFRIRAGYYKRIDFVKVSVVDNKLTIRSNDLMIGDEIAVSGLGFLRISEIAAFDGAPSGHSH